MRRQKESWEMSTLECTSASDRDCCSTPAMRTSSQLSRRAGLRQHWAGSCEKIARTGGLTDDSVCPTLQSKNLRARGAGAFACQPILSRPPALFVAAGVNPEQRAVLGRHACALPLHRK